MLCVSRAYPALDDDLHQALAPGSPQRSFWPFLDLPLSKRGAYAGEICSQGSDCCAIIVLVRDHTKICRLGKCFWKKEDKDLAVENFRKR